MLQMAMTRIKIKVEGKCETKEEGITKKGQKEKKSLSKVLLNNIYYGLGGFSTKKPESEKQGLQ